MTPFKNNAGFFTFESLITISLVGVFLTPLIVMQTNTLTRVTYSSRSLQRLFFMKQLLNDARHEQSTQQDEPQQFSFTGTQSDPATELVYTLEPIPSDSSLSAIPGLLRERTEATYKLNKQQMSMTLISFLYRPKSEKEEERT